MWVYKRAGRWLRRCWQGPVRPRAPRFRWIDLRPPSGAIRRTVSCWPMPRWRPALHPPVPQRRGDDSGRRPGKSKLRQRPAGIGAAAGAWRSDPDRELDVRPHLRPRGHRSRPGGEVTHLDGAEPRAMIVMRREDVLIGGPSADDLPPERLERDLAGLMRVSAAISAVRGLAALERPLIELIAEVVPADRGAVIPAAISAGKLRPPWPAAAGRRLADAAGEPPRDRSGAAGCRRRAGDECLIGRRARGAAGRLRQTSGCDLPGVGFTGPAVRRGAAAPPDVDRLGGGHRPRLTSSMPRRWPTRTAGCRRSSTSITTWSATAPRCGRSTGRSGGWRRAIRRC